MRRKSRTTSIPRETAPASKPSLFTPLSMAIFGAIFAAGVLIGMVFSTSATIDPGNVVSREVIDRSAPNPELCVQYGASAMVTDMRVFITLNPFNVYVTQPSMRPGCVLRRNNWALLEQRKLVSSDQVRECKNRMNTFGYTGALEGKPEIQCVYQNDSAGNLFLNQPGAVSPRTETDEF